MCLSSLFISGTPMTPAEDRRSLKTFNIQETKDGMILEVHVKPRSREFRIEIEADEITVHCREEPFRGKVNKELVKEFTKILHKDVELVSGFTSSNKRLLIRNTKKQDVERVLKDIAGSTG